MEVAGGLGLSNLKVDKTIAPGSELILPFQSGLMTFKAPYYSSSMAVWIWPTNNTDNVNILQGASMLGKEESSAFYAYKNSENFVCIKNNTNSNYRVIIFLL